MGGKLDQVKGRLKEAAGALTDDDRLRREGQLDQVVGKVKGTAERAVDTVKDALTGNRSPRPAIISDVTSRTNSGASSGILDERSIVLVAVSPAHRARNRP